MLYKEMFAVCSNMNIKHINTLRPQKVEFFGAIVKLPKASTY
jgi:hypothetical protein